MSLLLVGDHWKWMPSFPSYQFKGGKKQMESFVSRCHFGVHRHTDFPAQTAAAFAAGRRSDSAAPTSAPATGTAPTLRTTSPAAPAASRAATKKDSAAAVGFQDGK
ncbi:hypothetical protein GW17_00060728 [Ensete ventricosum]|nr:hypothetical protein GW17_00060728 [Ensete ventricosum]